ncbi:hypothetical protein LTR37_014992 [Vermiconidia calcicola]|uniref:Uncharacterized protein n=1 Tax=Vermiconidia calcicola TaxID=1690605 RepID=A0ACC3MS19_9PEZI|nr:hypothetical protein LTR37_014992 [Vermiconidia calcicola]
MADNRAAWLDGAGKEVRLADAPMPKAKSGFVVIRNKAIAINPVDWKIQDSGYFIKSWPMILGCDVAGEVVEVGDNVTHVKKGDRVAAHMISLLSQDPSDGGFQLYSAAQAGTTAVIPQSVSFAEGAVFPLAFDTAVVGLCSPAADGFLGLPLPSLNPTSSGKVIAVWGGSSSVGALTIQMAVAAGVKVVTTASQHNFDFCKSCGASEVIDYKSAGVVDDVVSAVKRLGGTFAGTYDAISLPDQSYKHVLPIMEKLGGGNLATVLAAPEKTPDNVKAGSTFGVNELTHPLWKDFVTKAIENGQLKCVPEPLIIGNGLESVQKGLNENKKGVSAKKVVIEL